MYILLMIKRTHTKNFRSQFWMLLDASIGFLVSAIQHQLSCPASLDKTNVKALIVAKPHYNIE